MTLRLRLTLVAAGVVAVVVALACATTYFVMRHELQSQLDGSLKSTARTVQLNQGQIGSEHYGSNLVEVVNSQGVVADRTFNPPLAADKAILDVAQGHDQHGFYRDITVQGFHLREYVLPAADNRLGIVE